MTERKFFIIGEDGWIRSRMDPHSNGPFARRFYRTPKYRKMQGRPMVEIGEALYSIRGKVYRYNYRLLRQLWRVQHTGHAQFWLEDNPTPLNFDKDEWKTNLDSTAHMLHEIRESDMPERLARPRRMDFMAILVGFLAGALLVFTILSAAGKIG